MYGGQHWFGGGFMWIFWIALIVAIFWGAKVMSSNGKNTSNNQKTALDIVKDRYAKGEIDKEEFEQKRKDLSV
ncbi:MULTISPECIES: SHOCT domain-containing protein [unclassified Cocleimonas]|jgi:putative membrane protein|uniref:SHOCT domain-containing protein n=1 Tax=unclassified Cocleimonas TaxID=2639732 RepID=UPI0026023021|nr:MULTISPECIES: SHOCT domain-containing protein [unclassified Cocleimonas]MEB8432752.1 SHOCT domain-containing protein [Cocleimonas sp. KMM 6892]MEC4715611.1 SHOCT domain-containing protein [Cocleimonas sp. KMM 6895]MEC4744771.1 SHOCT domain-containing protein [Cocleimonas sp. KMM 6896]